MRIEVKLYGDLKKYAPGDETRFVLELAPGAVLGEVLDMLSIPPDYPVSLINGRRATETTPFETGDTLVLFPPVSGG